MTKPAPPPRSSAESSDLAPSLFQGPCRDLRRLGCSAIIVLYSDCGDVDVRLQVAREGCTGIVELLGPYAGIPERSGSWHAVRIEADGRSIWRGPPKCCRYPQLIEFVVDLLMRPPELLTTLYQAL